MILATPDEVEAFRKLDLAANGASVRFTPDEGIVLRRVIKIISALDALGWLGRGVKQALIWAVGMYAAWVAFGGMILALLNKK